ncbi:MAG: tetratricopeptide repeat protein [Bacteroidota bacterium]
MLRFAHPEYLWLLLSVPAVAVGFLFLNLWRKSLLRRFMSDALVPELAPDASGGKRATKQFLLLIALAFLILAVANPQVGTRLEEIKREGIDLFVALDVSLSMKAEDIKPSRLEKAKRDVSALLRKLSGDRVGLIVFAGDAFVQFPLTADYAAADLFISSVDVDAVPTPGTTIASAIEVALKSFSTDLPTQKAIIVVSDGENTEGDVMSAIDEARKASVRVYTIGMGTLEGAPIPIYNESGARVDYKRDRAGSIVLTKLDETMLQQIAVGAQGTYRRATSGGNEIDEVFRELGSLEKTEFGAKQVTGYESRYQYPLAIAILFLVLETTLSERRGRLIAGLRKLFLGTPAVAAILLLTALAQIPASAQTVRSHISEGNRVYEKGRYEDAEVSYKKALEKDPKSREGQFNLGNAQYKQQRFEESMREFANSAAVAKAPVDRADSYYNLGNSLYRSNKYPESIEAYKRALRLNPDDEDARYNLQMAREKLKQQQQNKQQQNKDQKKDQKDQKDQQNQQQQKQDQQQQQQQQQNQQAKSDQTKQEQAQRKNQMPKQEAERILEALRNNEKEVQKKLQKREAVKIRVEKDW